MAKLRGSLSPTMHEMADQMHPVAQPPPPTTRANATPTLDDARKVQAGIQPDSQGNKRPMSQHGSTGGISIGNPLSAAADIIKNIRKR